ncbi:SPOR domain-containing protein [Paenibacillus sp. PL91]|uniref:SPOR domain-containing protein n=1 Tax=Paenibacillus sp. PL91 TaxID=2729538 RepID=UPI00145F11A6|nr:SPOR domain-containing protein [Paenibacillus sp. PL91]MBC9202561.1 SPOR domain-containing protein [Paenibacillus sp. PL91]
MNQKNRITYRFDRNGQSINNENRSTDEHYDAPSNSVSSQMNENNANKQAKKNVIPLYPYTEQQASSEINPWNSPFQEDISALEQLIRDSDTKPMPAAAPTQAPLQKEKKEKLKVSKPVVLAAPIQQEDDDDIEERHFKAETVHGPIHSYEDELVYDEPRRNKQQYTRMKRKTGTPSWFNVFLSVAAALATGALFGYLLLSLFTGASIWPGGADETPQTQPVTGNEIIGETSGGKAGNAPNTGEGAQTETDNDSAAKPDPNAAMVSLEGLDQTYFMLQFGVFSNTEGKDAALAQLAEKGLAGAALTSAADYRVYAGMGGDRAKAQTIRGQMADMDLYIKEVSITAPSKLPFKGEQASAQAFFTKTREIVQMLDELTIAQLEQPSLSPLSEAAAASWQTEHQKWTKNAATMRIGIEDAAGKAYLDKVIQAINTAAKSMVEYDKKPSRAYLWSTQTQLMKAIISQKEWFESISAL